MNWDLFAVACLTYAVVVAAFVWGWRWLRRQK